MIPGSLAIMSGTATAPPPSFDPATLFAAGEKGAWYDAAAWATTAWQDTARTVAVTAAGQSIAGLSDKSGRGNHLSQSTSTAQPTLEISGGLAGILGDGSNDGLVGGSIFNVINVTTPWECFVAFRYTSVSTDSTVPYSNAAIVGDSDGWIGMAYARSSGVIGAGMPPSNGTTRVEIETPVTSRTVYHGRWTTTQKIISINGGSESTVACSASSPGGSLRVLKAYGPAANARVHEIILVGYALTPTQRTNCIHYLKSKWGVA